MPDCVIHILGYSRDVPTVVGGGRDHHSLARDHYYTFRLS